MTLKWKIQPAPTGRYRSFECRGWPDAWYPGDIPAAAIYCETTYSASHVKDESHGELTVRIADHSVKPFKWRTLKARFSTLDQAKAAASEFIEAFPQLQPASTS